MRRRASRRASSSARCGLLTAAARRPRGTKPEIGRGALARSRGGMTADVVRAGFWAVTSPSGTRPDARSASNAPVKSPVEAFARGDEPGPGRDARTEGGGAGATGGAPENDENEGGGGAGAAPIVGIALVSPGSDEKERRPWGIRVFAASSIARRASPASVDLERAGAGAGAGAVETAGGAAISKSAT